MYINPSGGLPVSATKANLAQRKMMQRSLSANQIGESSFCHFEDLVSFRDYVSLQRAS